MAVSGRDILRQLRHALDEIGAAGGYRLAEDLRIGEDEIGRRKRLCHLPHVKQRLGAGVLIQPLRLRHHPVCKTDGRLIGLEKKIEERVGLPVGIGKTFASALCGAAFGRFLRGRIGGSGKLRHRFRPQIVIARQQMGLRFQ